MARKTTPAEVNRAARGPSARIAWSRAYGVAVVAVLLVSTSHWRVTAPVFDELLSFLGWVLIALGAMGRAWAGSYICGVKNQRLQTDGPYSLCRNPLYLFTFVGGVGVHLLSGMLLLPVIFAAIFLASYSSVIHREEKVLLAIHGRDYETYRARVPRFWPRVRGYAEPPSHSVEARNYRKHLGDLIWFVIAGAVVKLIGALHSLGFLPTVLLVY